MTVMDLTETGGRPNRSTAITYQVTAPDDIVVSADPECWTDVAAVDANLPAPEEAPCCTPDCPCSPDWPELGGEG